VEDQKLQDYFKFNEADLQANRRGLLTDKQKARFVADNNYYKKWSLIGGIILMVITAIGLVIAVSTWLTAGWAAATPYDIWTLVGLFLSWLVLKRYFYKPKVIIAKAQGPANVVEAQWYSENHRANIYHELQIGGKRFTVSKILADIMHGDEYIVYYNDSSLQHPYDQAYRNPSDDILSAELLRKAGGASVTQPVSNNGAEDSEIIEYLKKGDLIGAIRRHRAIYNSNYEDAKKAVEMLKARLGY
jgi:hypothetical protein